MVALVLAWTPRTLHLAVPIFLNIIVKVTIWMWIVMMPVDPNGFFLFPPKILHL